MNTKLYLRKAVYILVTISLVLAGCGGGKASEPPFIRVISGTVQTGKDGAWAAAVDNVQLQAGAGVKTCADCRAALVFKDGSMIELEPDTEVAFVDGESISLNLAAGMIWVASNESSVSVDAGGPVAVASKAGFSVTRSGGEVKVTSVGSVIKFAAGGSEVQIPSGQMSISSNGSAPTSPANIEVKNALRITLTGEAMAYIADPSGRGIGYHPTKEIPVNQIPNGWYVGKTGRPQVISVPNIAEGEYTIILVAANNQSAWKIKVGLAGADLNYSELETSSSITWGTPTGITLIVKMDENGVPTAEMSPIWTLYVDPPGKVALGEELKRTTISAGETAPVWTNLQ